jgi:GntR family transcriptional regulator, transcriptional repressor for pyruvate dehydrogenase complex
VTQKTNARRRPNLTLSLIEDLRARITNGTLQPGDKLPTEQKLVQEYGVSRTVIREAVAGLRADGLVEPRHGVGVFVLEPPKSANSFLSSGGETGRVSSIVETLELRAAVEIEAAGIAADRRSPGQEARIEECYRDMQQLVESGKIDVQTDYAFHIAIAQATNNPKFVEFLEFLGHAAMPRSQMVRLDEGSEDSLQREQRLHDEHRAIMEAISQRNPDAAREAMREHLKGSQERYRRLISTVA